MRGALIFTRKSAFCCSCLRTSPLRSLPIYSGNTPSTRYQFSSSHLLTFFTLSLASPSSKSPLKYLAPSFFSAPTILICPARIILVKDVSVNSLNSLIASSKLVKTGALTSTFFGSSVTTPISQAYSMLLSEASGFSIFTTLFVIAPVSISAAFMVPGKAVTRPIKAIINILATGFIPVRLIVLLPTGAAASAPLFLSLTFLRDFAAASRTSLFTSPSASSRAGSTSLPEHSPSNSTACFRTGHSPSLDTLMR